jgi:hypothetical protein
MVEAAGNIAFHIEDRSRGQFEGDRTVKAAVLHELTVIGEVVDVRRMSRLEHRATGQLRLDCDRRAGLVGSAHVSTVEAGGVRSCDRQQRSRNAWPVVVIDRPPRLMLDAKGPP